MTDGTYFHDRQRPNDECIDEALIEAAAVGLFAERVGLPLQPWQQRVVDHMLIKDAHR